MAAGAEGPSAFEAFAPKVRASKRSGAVFAWTTWTVMLAGVLTAIGFTGRNIPLAEDWLLVAPLTGNEPELGKWLWAQNNEHRLPLPRLLYLGLLKAAGSDFRAGMVANTLIVAGIAAALMLALRSARGGEQRAADAVIPLVLLHLGHAENLMWGWQIQFVVSVTLSAIVLLEIMRIRPTRRTKDFVLVALALVMLPLTGASGLVLGGALVPWAALLAWRTRRTGSADSIHPGALVLGSSTVLTVALIALYFAGYERPEWNPPSPSLGVTLATAAQMLALALGPAAKSCWWIAIPVVVAASTLTGALLLRALLKEKNEERVRAFGLLCFLAGTLALALAIGWGRGGQSPEVRLPNRYALFAAVLFPATLFALELYAAPRARKVLQGMLLAGMLVVLPVNTWRGIRWSRNWYLPKMEAVERDLESGLSPALLAKRHRDFLMHWNEPGLEDRIRMLRDAGVGPFVKAGR